MNTLLEKCYSILKDYAEEDHLDYEDYFLMGYCFSESKHSLEILRQVGTLLTDIRILSESCLLKTKEKNVLYYSIFEGNYEMIPKQINMYIEKAKKVSWFGTNYSLSRSTQLRKETNSLMASMLMNPEENEKKVPAVPNPNKKFGTISVVESLMHDNIKESVTLSPRLLPHKLEAFKNKNDICDLEMRILEDEKNIKEENDDFVQIDPIKKESDLSVAMKKDSIIEEEKTDVKGFSKIGIGQQFNKGSHRWQEDIVCEQCKDVCVTNDARGERVICLEHCFHFFHAQCFNEAMQIEIENEMYPLQCPSCYLEISGNDLQTNLSKDLYTKYMNIAIQKTSVNLFCCPNKSCNFQCELMTTTQYFKCPSCKKEFCTLCKKPYHYKYDCSGIAIRREKEFT